MFQTKHFLIPPPPFTSYLCCIVESDVLFYLPTIDAMQYMYVMDCSLSWITIT